MPTAKLRDSEIKARHRGAAPPSDPYASLGGLVYTEIETAATATTTTIIMKEMMMMMMIIATVVMSVCEHSFRNWAAQWRMYTLSECCVREAARSTATFIITTNGPPEWRRLAARSRPGKRVMIFQAPSSSCLVLASCAGWRTWPFINHRARKRTTRKQSPLSSFPWNARERGSH